MVLSNNGKNNLCERLVERRMFSERRRVWIRRPSAGAADETQKTQPWGTKDQNGLAPTHPRPVWPPRQGFFKILLFHGLREFNMFKIDKLSFFLATICLWLIYLNWFTNKSSAHVIETVMENLCHPSYNPTTRNPSWRVTI